MGGPKAVMPIADEPWWAAQRRAILATGRGDFWVLSQRVHDQIGDALRDASGDDYTIADDRAPMFDSVLAGVRALESNPPPGVFVLPVDVPMPGADVLDALPGAGLVAVPGVRATPGHPLWLAWDWVCAHLLPCAHGRLDELARPHRRIVEVEDPRVVMNLNRPADARAYEAFLADETEAGFTDGK